MKMDSLAVQLDRYNKAVKREKSYQEEKCDEKDVGVSAGYGVCAGTAAGNLYGE